MRAQVNSSTNVDIWWLIQTFKYQCLWVPSAFWIDFGVWFEDQKRFFLSKCPHYIKGYILNLGSMFFIFSLVLDLAYIDYTLRQIWSVYLQNLQCCEHSNKCLLLVIQQVEVLLNFFWESIFKQHQAIPFFGKHVHKDDHAFYVFKIGSG